MPVDESTSCLGGIYMEDRYELFTLLLSRIYRNIMKIKTAEMEHRGLKSTHISCIYYLYKNGNPLTAVDLCAVCEEDKAMISRAVNFLESNGYIVRDTGNKKAYRSLLHLTDKGRETGEFISAKIEETLNKASSGLSDEDRKNLYSSLRLISDNLNDIVTGDTESNMTV